MNNGVVKAVVRSLFDFYSGRYARLISIEDELKDFVVEENTLEGLVIDIKQGREMTVIGFSSYSLHGPILIRRYPCDKDPDIDIQIYETLKEIMVSATMTIKALPSAMLTRKIYSDHTHSDWETAEEDKFGFCVKNGLLSKRCTFCYGAAEFSLFFEAGDNVIGYNFKSPIYINNVFYIPTRGHNGFTFV